MPASDNVSQIHFNRRECILRNGSSDEIYHLKSSKLRRKTLDFKISTFKSGVLFQKSHTCYVSFHSLFCESNTGTNKSLIPLKTEIWHILKFTQYQRKQKSIFSVHEPTVVSRTQRANDIGRHWRQTCCNASWGTRFKVCIFKMPDIDTSTQKQQRACLAVGITPQLLQVWQHSCYHL